MRVMPYHVALLVLSAILLGDVAAILHMNHGQFAYVFDDTYIAINMAEQILHGHYGVFPDEPASASSSIVWPFLLAPLLKAGLGVWAPFCLSFFFAILAAYQAGKLIETLLPGEDKRPLALLVSAIIVPGLNLPGLVLCGLEHTLQLWLTLLLLKGLFTLMEQQTAKPSRQMLFALIAGPLARYENLTLSGISLLLLFGWGYRREAFFAAVILGSMLLGFSAFLVSEGLALIPHSILSKMRFGHLWLVKWIYDWNQQKILLLALVLWGCVQVVRRESGRKQHFAAMLALALVVHAAVGGMGYAERYEIYMVAAAFFGLVFLHQQSLQKLIFSQPVSMQLVRGGIGLSCALWIYIYNSLWIVPHDANEVYRQQFQMRRFVTEYYKAPVALNDIGLVGYQNPYKVVDLAGLSSAETYQAVSAVVDGKSPGWLQEVTTPHHAQLAIIYDGWFSNHIPPTWKKIAVLNMGAAPTYFVFGEISFYATSETEAKKVRALLKKFISTLPEGVTITIL